MGALRILGIDPGLQRTGWGVIAQEGNRLSHLAHGVIETSSKDALSDRLAVLFEAIRRVTADHRPECAAVEETFATRNGASTLKLGQARGALIASLATSGLSVAEYAPNLVKKSVVGVGHADKGQIKTMVSILLPDSKAPGFDACDALAVAITHAHLRGRSLPAAS